MTVVEAAEFAWKSVYFAKMTRGKVVTLVLFEDQTYRALHLEVSSAFQSGVGTRLR